MSANTTLKQVASRAGVAWSTASYAINGGPKPVSEETRERVLKAAQELGYSSNLIARGLVTGRAMMLGILVPEVRSYMTSSQLAGVEEAAQALGYTIMLSVYRSEIDRALLAQRSMAARRMDGIICLFETAGSVNGKLDSILTGLSELGLPFVSTYHTPVEGVAADYFVIDQEQGGYLATKHLLEQGRRNVAFLGPLHLYAGRGRFAGYQRAHAEFGLTPREDLFVSTTNFTLLEGEMASEQLLACANDFDAVFAPSENLAASTIRILRRAGRTVPDDVAVVGFDNGAVCEALDPTLSTIDCPLEELGRASVRRLIQRLDTPGDWQPQTQTLQCSLVQRQSS